MEHVENIQLFVDGGSRGNPGPSACAYVIKNADGEVLKVEGIYLGESTNNIAEYNALLNGLDALQKMDVHELAIFSDSELMVKQLIGEYQVRDSDLLTLFEQVQRKLLGFDRWHIKHIRREMNRQADQLVNETLDKEIGLQKDQNKHEQGPCKSLPKVLVEVTQSSRSDVCPSPMQKGQWFVFSSCIPAGLCIHAANVLLPAVIEMQTTMQKDNQNAIVTLQCNANGCGAKFNLKLI